MKDLVKVFCLFLLFSCNTPSQKEILKTHVSILDSVDLINLQMDTFSLRQYLNTGMFNLVKIDLLNNTDSALHYWTNSCSWQSNWILSDKSINWYVMCPKNIPVLVELSPHESKSYFGIVEFTDSTIFNNREFKIGFVLIKKNEVHRDFEYNQILDDKIKKKTDLFWSNPVKPKKIKLSITRTVVLINSSQFL